MSANPSFLPQPASRPDHVRAVFAGGVYSYLLRDCLDLYASDAQVIEKAYHLPADNQHLLGYRSAPEPVRLQPMVRNEDLSRWLDSLPGDEFLDWLTYSKEPLSTDERPDAPADEYNLALNLLESDLSARFGEIEGIPGLYLDDRLRVKMPRRGLIVPCRVDSIIRALLVYPRPSEANTYWLSSNGLHGGAKASASMHVANQHRAMRDHVAVIVCHTIEADALAWESGECVIASNNLSPLRLMRDVRAALPDLRGCVVSSSLGEHLARTLRENGLRVRVDELEGASDE